MVTWEAGLDQVVVSDAGNILTTDPRSWTSGVSITNTDHVIKVANFIHQFHTPQPSAGDVLVGDLSDYDRMFSGTIHKKAGNQNCKAAV